MNTFFIVLFCFVVLGIVGVSQLSGKMSYCSDILITTKQECVGFSHQGLARHWKPRELNFDWIGKAVVTMFVVATKDRWTELMYQAVDAQDSRGLGPYQNTSPGYFLLYIFAVFIGGFLLLNIFAGVVVDTHKTFVNSKRRELQVVQEVEAVQQKVDKMPKSRSRRLVRTVVQRFEFDILMLSLIIFDIIGISLMSYKASKLMVSMSIAANIFFTCVYAAEAMAKIYAFYGQGYFRNSWNVFEFVLVLISVWGLCLEYFDMESFTLNGESFVRVLRIFRAIRVMRAFRLLNFEALKNLQALAACLANAGGHVVEVLGILLVVYIVFGNITVGIFGNMCDHSNSHISSTSILSPESGGLVPRCMLVDENDLLDGISFSSVSRACIILLTMDTADSWSHVMRKLALSPGVRKLGDGAVPEARIQILNYFQTRDESYLGAARALLPGCQTSEELEGLSDVLDCSDQLGNQCGSTCGSRTAAYVVCVLFVCLTSLVILNLLLAVLMQSLQEHQEKVNNRAQDSRKSGNNVSLLMNVSKAATGWRNAHFKGLDSDSDDDGPVFAGVSPLNMMHRETSGISFKQINSSEEHYSNSHSEPTSLMESPVGGSQRNRRPKSMGGSQRDCRPKSIPSTGSRDVSPARSPMTSHLAGMLGRGSWRGSWQNSKTKLHSEIVDDAPGNGGSPTRGSPPMSPILSEAVKIPSDQQVPSSKLHDEQKSEQVPVDAAAATSGKA